MFGLMIEAFSYLTIVPNIELEKRSTTFEPLCAPIPPLVIIKSSLLIHLGKLYKRPDCSSVEGNSVAQVIVLCLDRGGR